MGAECRPLPTPPTRAPTGAVGEPARQTPPMEPALIVGEAVSELEALARARSHEAAGSAAIREAGKKDIITAGFPYDKRMGRETYEAAMAALQIELVKCQAWVAASGARVSSPGRIIHPRRSRKRVAPDGMKWRSPCPCNALPAVGQSWATRGATGTPCSA